MSDISLRVKWIPSSCRGCAVQVGRVSAAVARRRWLLAMGPGHGLESEARQVAMTLGLGDRVCRVTMQAAMAVVLAKRWPYVVLRWP